MRDSHLTPPRQLRSLSDTRTFVTPRVFTQTILCAKDRYLTPGHLSGTICLKHSATVILSPLVEPPSRRTCLIIISARSVVCKTFMPVALRVLVMVVKGVCDVCMIGCCDVFGLAACGCVRLLRLLRLEGVEWDWMGLNGIGCGCKATGRRCAECIVTERL